MSEKVIKEFWIGFRDASYFVRHFLKKGFQHTYVLAKSNGSWVELNPRNHAFEFFVLPFDEEEKVPELIASNHRHKFLRVLVEQNVEKRNPDLNIFKTIHCTNIVKYITGIKLMAYTPYQLYKSLTRMSGQRMGKKGILKVEIL
jgi:hypothetical protein